MWPKRGALLAGALYIVVGAIVLLDDDVPRNAVAIALAMGLPGVALLGAGLAPAAIGSAVDGIAVGLALAIGAPVAAVTSLLIGGFILGAAIGNDLTGPILRAGVTMALGAAPIVALAAAAWVIADPPHGSIGPAGLDRVEHLESIAEADPSRLDDVAEHPEVGVLALAQAAVRDDRPQGVEVAVPGIGVLGRDGAAGVGLRDRQDGVADRDAPADPRVLDMGVGPAELDEHPEPPGIHAIDAGLARQRGDGPVGDQAGRVAAARAAGPVTADDADPSAGERGQRLRPRPDHDVPDPGTAVDRRLDRLGELDVVLDDRAVREGQPQPRRPRIGVAGDLHERSRR